MSDRELLMAAARAFWAGEIDDVCSIDWSDADDGVLYTHGDNQDHNGRDRAYRWNPLQENADAFELAVKLGLKVMPYPIYGVEKHSVIVSKRVPSTDPDSPFAYTGPECVETYEGEPHAATRRAIVRAAAELQAPGATAGAAE